MPQTITPPSVLAANLGCLGRRNAELAAVLDAATPRPDAVFADTPQGVPSLALGGTPLCSRHRPLDEAARLAAQVDLVKHAVVVVLGFGAGYHVRALAERLGDAGIIVVFEPDRSLLRSVLERIDHSAWMRGAQLLFVTDGDDRGTLARKLEGAESVIAQGVAFMEHPPSRRRIGDRASSFTSSFAELVSACKITFATTLMRSVDTVRNMLLNIDHYAAGAGIADLEQAAAGRPAITVSAGPSLHRSLDLLATPGLRDRAVIIAAQTTLRPLLAAGVRPHFVTALDFHEISRRFYEGLTPEDVRGVTLVAEPKAHPVILDVFPGAVRCCRSGFLDQVLGAHARPMGELPAGATVAHLAVYLARFLGCNPVAMVGQDLAFTDGLYYLPGTAIDDTWAPELNPFNTMEMMQWQRIARHRAHLSRVPGVDGRPVYTDRQMLTYLHQFERDFAAFREAGLEIIDATGGGVPKQHATAMPLDEVLGRYATEPLPALPRPPAGLDPDRVAAARGRVEAIRREVETIRDTAGKTAALLRRMIRDQSDQAKMQTHFRTLDRYRKAVDACGESYAILNHLNQLGLYKRYRADRRLHMQEGLDTVEFQKAQLERDLENVTWTADAARELAVQLGSSDRVLAGEPVEPAMPPDTALVDELAADVGDGPARVAAIIPVDPDRNGLGIPRSLAAPFAGRPVIQATLERLGRSRHLESIILIAPEGFDVEALIDRERIGLPVHVDRCAGSPYAPGHAAIAAARLWSPTCWRGGIGGMSVYDEVLCAPAMDRVMRERGLTAALIAGPDWPLIDPDETTGCGAVVARHLELPAQHKLVFTQAPPGLAGCLVSAGLMHELALCNRLSTIGGLLVYQPQAPQHDPIARTANVQIDYAVRRSRLRCTFDAPRYRRRLDAAFAGRDVDRLGAAGVIERLETHVIDEPPRHLVVELTGPRGDMDVDAAARVFARVSEPGDVAVTFAGAGDPLRHDRFDEIIRHARAAGIRGVHVRTALTAGTAILDRLLQCEPDVVSVDLDGDGDEAAIGAMEHLVNNRVRLTDHAPTAALALPWIVPRITRRAETVDAIDDFYDRWQGTLGAAVIDPAPDDDAALLPVVVPPAVKADESRHTVTVRADGSVVETGDR